MKNDTELNDELEEQVAKEYEEYDEDEEYEDEEEEGKRKLTYPILLTLIVLVALCIIFNFSYAFAPSIGANSNNSGEVATLEITMNDGGKGVTLIDSFPLSDKDGKNINSYSFEVKNTGDNQGKYSLLIEDLPIGKIDDGCTKDTLLTRSQLHYQLLLNGKQIALDSLDKVKLNVLTEQSIAKNATQKYELRVWVGEDAKPTDWENKHYHYRVSLVPEV